LYNIPNTMLSQRFIRSSLPLSRRNNTLVRHFSSESTSTTTVTTERKKAPNPENIPDLITPKNSIQRYAADLKEKNPNIIWGLTTPPGDNIPVLPANPQEIATLDTAQDADKRLATRKVLIRQKHTQVSQQAKNPEYTWILSFMDDGETADTWSNPLMGWVSSADPMSATQGLQMTFNSAKEAVYFAKKKGYNYEVAEPIIKHRREDDAQYQDNFLPQNIQKQVARDGTKCHHWKRSKSMASHYFRPLKYHGDGTVPQYGPNPDQEIEPDVVPVQKLR